MCTSLGLIRVRNQFVQHLRFILLIIRELSDGGDVRGFSLIISCSQKSFVLIYHSLLQRICKSDRHLYPRSRTHVARTPPSPRVCVRSDGWCGNSTECATGVWSGSWRHHTARSFMMYWQSGNIVEPTAAPEGFCQLNDLKSPKCEPEGALRRRIIGLRNKWDIVSCFRSFTFGNITTFVMFKSINTHFTILLIFIEA